MDAGQHSAPVSALAAPIQVPDCFRLQAAGGVTAGPTLQGLQLLQSAVKITLLYNQPSAVNMLYFFHGTSHIRTPVIQLDTNFNAILI